MLTCINPSVTFKMKTGANNWVAYKGVAVALKWLLPLMKQFGGTHPPEERIRRDITTHVLEMERVQTNSSTSMQMEHVFPEGLVELK